MWTRTEIQERLRQEGLRGECWGRFGIDAAIMLERALEVDLGKDLYDFVCNIGNLRVDPLNVVAAGDDVGSFGAVSETRAIGKAARESLGACAIKIMDHAGEAYVYFPADGTLAAYDAGRPVKGEETLRWDNLESFLEWVFREAKEIAESGPQWR